jgi:hypothetical protein
MWLVLVGIGLVVGWLLLERAGEIFCVSVRDGRCLVVRGRIPGGLLEGIADVVARAHVERGTVRAVKGEHHARLVCRGMNEGTTQRLRNVFGTHPVQKLRSAPIATKRNLGQLLGVTWLAWLLLELGRRNGGA